MHVNFHLAFKTSLDSFEASKNAAVPVFGAALFERDNMEGRKQSWHSLICPIEVGTFMLSYSFWRFRY